MAREDITITGLVRQALPDGPEVWVATVRLPNNAVMYQVFPVDTLEWRAAEYEIEDREVLLDMVLAEPWLADGLDHTHPSSLHRAATIAEARNHHLARIEAFKVNRRWVIPEGFRRALRDDSPVNPAAVALKRELVRQARQQPRTALQPALPDEQNRIGQLAGQLAVRGRPQP